MNSAYLYLQLYKLFDDITPIKADCGVLCEKACCGGDDDCGMLLFPCEYEVFRLLEPNWMKIAKTDMTYEYNGKTYRVPILTCDGDCDRYERPLACRIFPLTPHLDKDGKLEIIKDPRAMAVCPLAKGLDTDEFDKRFTENVLNAFRLLMKIDRFKAFMNVYNEYINGFLRFQN